MTKTMHAFRVTGLATLLAIGLSACGGRVPLISPYRIDVQQGNVTTQEMVSSLKTGMSKDQVKFILGTPLLTDMFHSDRWDYVYRLEPGKGPITERRFTLYFENGALARIDGDVIAQATQTPQEAAAAKAAAEQAAKAKADAQAAAEKSKPPVKDESAQASADKPAEDKPGFWARLKAKLGF